MFYFVEDFPQIEENTRTVIISKKIIGKKSLLKCYNDRYTALRIVLNTFLAHATISPQKFYAGGRF